MSKDESCGCKDNKRDTKCLGRVIQCVFEI